MQTLTASFLRNLLLGLSLSLSLLACDTTRQTQTTQAPVPSYPEPTPPPPAISYVETLTDGNFKEMVKEASGLRVAYFSASWCGPCRTLAPAVDQVSREYKDRVMLGKLDVDANPTTRILHDVNSIPTFIFYKNGTIVHRSSGLVTEQYLRNIIDRLL